MFNVWKDVKIKKKDVKNELKSLTMFKMKTLLHKGQF